MPDLKWMLTAIQYKEPDPICTCPLLLNTVHLLKSTKHQIHHVCITSNITEFISGCKVLNISGVHINCLCPKVEKYSPANTFDIPRPFQCFPTGYPITAYLSTGVNANSVSNDSVYGWRVSKFFIVILFPFKVEKYFST
jgi:hypothetical protein